MKTFDKRNIKLWTQLFKQWLSAKFEAIATAIANIDLSPISDDIADVKSDVADVKGDVGDVKTAVENIDLSSVAKQGTNPNATNTAILAAFGNIDFSTLAKQGTNADATLTAILAALQSSEEDTPEELPAGLADRVMLLLDFFGITGATEYTALTSAEAIAIARDCQYNVMGTDWPIPTWLPTGVTEAQVESAAEGLGIPYHEPTQTA